MIPRSSSALNSQYPSIPSILLAGRRYTRIGNSTGNLRSAHALSRRNNFLRQSGAIVQPHNKQPVPAVATMQDNRNLVPCISHGLIHPPIGIACLAPLDFQMQVFMGRNHIRRVGPAGKLLTTPGLPAEDSDPLLGHFALGPSPLSPAVHQSPFFQETVMNVPINAPVAKGNRYRMFLE